MTRRRRSGLWAGCRRRRCRLADRSRLGCVLQVLSSHDSTTRLWFLKSEKLHLRFELCDLGDVVV